MLNYTPDNWYWAVEGNTAQVFSGASMGYVSPTDATYTAWLAAGGIPTRIAADDMILLQIEMLEAAVTERMRQEAMAGSGNTFASGPYAGKTAAQAITAIVSAKNALRATL